MSMSMSTPSGKSDKSRVRHSARHATLVLLIVAIATACLLALSNVALAERDESNGPRQSTEQSRSSSQHNSPEAAADQTSAPQHRQEVTTREATLDEVLAFARKAYARIDQEIEDYTCELYKREFVNGDVSGWQAMEVKIRHRRVQDGVLVTPLSVYLRFLKPESMVGREVLYVQNRDNGDLIARRGGTRSPNMTLQLIPTGPMAMEGNRYPITEIGFKNLAKRLIEVLEEEQKYRDGKLQIWENARVGERTCTHFRLTHHTRRPQLTYHMAEVSVDDELGIPIRYGAYDFPKEEGGGPQLLEQYVYDHVELNVGLTDEDFDPDNPAYHFQLPEDFSEQLTKD